MRKALFNFLGLAHIFMNKGAFDGYYYICYLESGFSIDGGTDIIAVYLSRDGKQISALASSPDDRTQQFIDPADLSEKLQEDIYNYLLNYE